MRLGSLWSGLSSAWLVVFLGLLLALAFRDNTAFENEGGVPTTVSTSIISVAVVGICLFYFFAELFESNYWDFVWDSVKDLESRTTKPHRKTAAKFTKKIYRKMRGTENRLGASMPRAAEDTYEIASVEDVEKYYTPPLIATWADGYLGDACIFLGMAGVTGQLSTATAWQIFFLVLFYRLLNMMIARFMYECFMNNVSESKDVNEIKGRISHPGAKSEPAKLSLKVMALSTQIAAIYIGVALMYVSFNEAAGLVNFPVFLFFVIFGFIVPEAVRIGLHLYFQIWEPTHNTVTWQILNPHMALWCMDLTVRIIVISIVVFDTKDTPGTRKYLMLNSNALVRDYLPMLYVPPFY
jgi:hypothetical protein